MGGRGSGRGGISLELVRAAERLLAAGWSQRAAARQVGLSHTTLQAIAAGEHFLQRLHDHRRHQRCRQCGAMADRQPCRLCELRAAGL